MRKPIRGRGRPNVAGIFHGRPAVGTAILVLAAGVIAFACSSGAGSRPSPSPAVASLIATAPAATATPSPRPLAAQIGVRGNLPMNDAIGLAASYGRTAGRAATAKPFAGEPDVGTTRDFTVVRLSGSALQGNAPPVVATVSATLLAKSPHAYFYEDAGLTVEPAAVQQAADKFEATVWPLVTAVFGEPLTPGVDGDPRIIVLQADLGGGTGGYYSGDDAYLKAVRPLSNEAEMVYMDRALKAGGESFNVVLAHEFQHLIHAKNDAGEEAWVNEGLSENASGLVGGAVSSTNSFAAQPQTQLDDWEGGSLAHYGAGAAFFRYLASRFGGDASLGAIAREPGHGEAGVDQFLASTGDPARFRDVFADWVAANVLNREAGPYGNPGQPLKLTIKHDLAVGSPVEGQAHQFGTDYYSVKGIDAGDFVLRFAGKPQVALLPAEPPAGGVVLWGNAEDGIDTTLTRDVDLTGTATPALTFKTWYDIERWYDWGYVSVSTDGGMTWQALPGDQTSTNDPARAAFGPGYTGESGGGETAAWVDERVSLAPYAGKKILLRFEYVTDGSTHGNGWAIDDVAIEGTSFHDATLTDPAWRSNGWVRIDGPLPQTYVVRLIEKLAAGDVRVLDVPLDGSQQGELRFSGAGVDEATVAIAGSTEGTNEGAPYTVELRSASTP
jgi:immune inhibitor A